MSTHRTALIGYDSKRKDHANTLTKRDLVDLVVA